MHRQHHTPDWEYQNYSERDVCSHALLYILLVCIRHTLNEHVNSSTQHVTYLVSVARISRCSQLHVCTAWSYSQRSRRTDSSTTVSTSAAAAAAASSSAVRNDNARELQRKPRQVPSVFADSFEAIWSGTVQDFRRRTERRFRKQLKTPLDYPPA